MSNQVEIIYSSSRNSKETGEIFRISPRKSARGIRPLDGNPSSNMNSAIIEDKVYSRIVCALAIDA
jgi:hypothetical protein